MYIEWLLSIVIILHDAHSTRLLQSCLVVKVAIGAFGFDISPIFCQLGSAAADPQPKHLIDTIRPFLPLLSTPAPSSFSPFLHLHQTALRNSNIKLPCAGAGLVLQYLTWTWVAPHDVADPQSPISGRVWRELFGPHACGGVL